MHLRRGLAVHGGVGHDLRDQAGAHNPPIVTATLVVAASTELSAAPGSTSTVDRPVRVA